MVAGVQDIFHYFPCALTGGYIVSRISSCAQKGVPVLQAQLNHPCHNARPHPLLFNIRYPITVLPTPQCLFKALTLPWILTSTPSFCFAVKIHLPFKLTRIAVIILECGLKRLPSKGTCKAFTQNAEFCRDSRHLGKVTYRQAQRVSFWYRNIIFLVVYFKMLKYL